MRRRCLSGPDEGPDRAERLLTLLEETGVEVVVLNTALQFSPPPPPELVEAIERDYGSARRVGQFIVRWR